MSILILVIVSIWAIAFAAAYLARISAGLGKRLSIAIVLGSYLAVSAVTLNWFGLTATGLIAVFGMLLPFVVAVLVTAASVRAKCLGRIRSSRP